MVINILKNEYWWGGVVNEGIKMPLSEDSACTIDMNDMHSVLDQSAPVFFSSKGRVIWSRQPFSISFWHGEIRINAIYNVELEKLGNNLKEAHLEFCRRYFDLSGDTPDGLFFKTPQYNTWMEFGFEQEQNKILDYARSIISKGMSPGILMIDDGWQKVFGQWEFDEIKFPDPQKMVEELHSLGFTVMLWTVPVVDPSAKDYKYLEENNMLVRNSSGEIAHRYWWEGKSPVLDLTNSAALNWYTSKLDFLMDNYSIDGFKLDAGDIYFYDEGDMLLSPCIAHEQTAIFNTLGKKYKIHEFRAGYNPKGQPYVFRLQDKAHSWDNIGINCIIPNSVMQGLVGSFFHCPDMVGGGLIDSAEGCFDQELYVRWVQASALCPMMQYSMAPWRILSDTNFEIIKKADAIHKKYGEYIFSLAKNAALCGEPIMRHMAYEYPDCGYETVADQYMLGDRILVAPVLKKYAASREVILPKGRWKLFGGEEVFEGNQTLNFQAPLDTVLYFEKQ